MKKILLLLLLLSPMFGWGQRIKRQVIASAGMPYTKDPTGKFCTAITVGQPPSAGTISSITNVVRQGYQQPIQDDCPIAIKFDVTETSIANCGTYYLFEFTGDIGPLTTVSWNFGPSASPKTASGAAPPLVAFTQLGSNEISVTVGDGTCQKTVMNFVDVKGTPFMANIAKTNATCYGDKGSILIAPVNGTSPYNYKWSNGAATASLKDLTPGQYLFTLTDSKGCTFTQSVEITGSTQPILLDGTVYYETCKDTRDGSIAVEILNAAQPLSFSWSNGGKTSKLDSLTKGEYKLTMKDSLGCTIDTTFKIKTLCDVDEEEFIPDTYSPNGDGFNDIWYAPMLDQFPENRVRIFNRWGTLIYDWESGTFKGWNGTNNKDEEMPIGAYFYVIELNSPKTDRVFKGSVTIIR